jgi:RNA recognition motif-containing protein
MTSTQARTASTTTTQTVSQDVADKKRIYVKWDFSDDVLKSFFTKFGSVVEARVAGGKNAPRSFGFVSFESEDAASKAIAAMNAANVTVQHQLSVQAASAEKTRTRRERAPRSEQKQGGQQRQSKGDGQRQSKGDGQGRRQGGQGQGRRQQNNNKDNQGGQQRQQRQADPDWGKVVRLNPDPIATAISTTAKLVTVTCGARQFRRGRTDGKAIQQLSLTADPSKGPFHCDFKLGAFDLKLLSVTVRTREKGDVRVACRVQQVSSGKSGLVVLNRRADGTTTHRFFSPRRGPVAEEEKSKPFDAFFVGVDSIVLDPATGLWKNLLLSLSTLVITPRSATAAATTTTTATTSASTAST